jgi:hypothetical protein
METFIINDRVKIEADYYETRNSWGHKAWLYLDGNEIAFNRARYYNRTWESYKYQSVMQGAVDKAEKILGEALTTECREYLRDYQEPSRLSHVAMIAQLGDFFTKDKKEANDWKVRMLKAGIPEGALQMPEDWDSLSEDEKQTRLDGAIATLK